MTIYNVAQGSAEWKQLRAGKPTASCFDKATKRLKLSQAAMKRGETQGESSSERENYKHKLIAEKLLNAPLPEISGFKLLEWGITHEALAAEAFAKHFGVELQRIGYIEENGLGCSPDRVVQNGQNNAPRMAVEIKCPTAPTLIRYLLEGLEEEYLPQMMGQMLVGHYDLVHFWAWYPGLPAYHELFERDESYIGWLRARLGEFQLEVDYAVAQIKAKYGV
jgi:hypothetical protein